MYKVEEIKNITKDMLKDFDRTQIVSKRYDLTDGVKSIQDISFVDDWSLATKEEIVDEFFLNDDYYNKGIYDQGRLIAFSSLSLHKIGPNHDYLELKMLHVDKAYRGKGLGKLLFEDLVFKAKSLKARKLYISAHSAVETQAFYMSLGCKDTEWLSEKAFKLEPYDIHMEYLLE